MKLKNLLTTAAFVLAGFSASAMATVTIEYGGDYGRYGRTDTQLVSDSGTFQLKKATFNLFNNFYDTDGYLWGTAVYWLNGKEIFSQNLDFSGVTPNIPEPSRARYYSATFAMESGLSVDHITFHAAASSDGPFLEVQPSFELVTAPVPEPETYALMGMGLVGLLAARRRKMALRT